MKVSLIKDFLCRRIIHSASRNNNLEDEKVGQAENNFFNDWFWIKPCEI